MSALVWVLIVILVGVVAGAGGWYAGTQGVGLTPTPTPAPMPFLPAATSPPASQFFQPTPVLVPALPGTITNPNAAPPALGSPTPLFYSPTPLTSPAAFPTGTASPVPGT